jgi:hypothetical protein
MDAEQLENLLVTRDNQDQSCDAQPLANAA